jgi:hypothetical protein
MKLKIEVLISFETSVATYHDPEYQNTKFVRVAFISSLLHYKRQIKGSEVAIF